MQRHYTRFCPRRLRRDIQGFGNKVSGFLCVCNSLFTATVVETCSRLHVATFLSSSGTFLLYSNITLNIYPQYHI